MGEFFKGWRRKVGLVTLAMACVLTTAWVRSYIATDELFIPGEQSDQTIHSLDGSIFWDRWFNPSGSVGLSIKLTSYGNDGSNLYPGDELDVEWRIDHAGFAFGKVSIISDRRMAWWIIPYWSLALPLTLLSAWLILAKPRKAKLVSVPAHDESSKRCQLEGLKRE